MAKRTLKSEYEMQGKKFQQKQLKMIESLIVLLDKRFESINFHEQWRKCEIRSWAKNLDEIPI